MKKNFEYISRSGLEQFRFYRVPKVFFEDPAFDELSTEAMILYSLLLDRMELSLENSWFDAGDRVFIIFSVKEVEQRMGCGHNKAIRLLRELDDQTGIGLIRRVRSGFGNPDHIYVGNFSSLCSDPGSVAVSGSNAVKLESQTSPGFKSKLSEVSKRNGNETDSNENERKEPEKKENKSVFGTFRNVYLSETELSRLKEDFPSDWEDRIEALSDYMAATGKRYRNHLAVIRSWDRRDQKKSKKTKEPKIVDMEEYL